MMIAVRVDHMIVTANSNRCDWLRDTFSKLSPLTT